MIRLLAVLPLLAFFHLPQALATGNLQERSSLLTISCATGQPLSTWRLDGMDFDLGLYGYHPQLHGDDVTMVGSFGVLKLGKLTESLKICSPSLVTFMTEMAVDPTLNIKADAVSARCLPHLSASITGIHLTWSLRISAYYRLTQADAIAALETHQDLWYGSLDQCQAELTQFTIPSSCVHSMMC
jgi:hypothetical protein